MSRKPWAEVPAAELQAEVYSRNGAFQRMLAFLAMAPLPAFVKDRGGRVLHMNLRAELLWHLTLDEVRGRTLTEILHLDFADQRVVERQDRLVIAGTDARVYLETVGAEDQLRRYSVLKFPVKDEDGEVLLVVFVLPHNP